jgi:hypothetical protein
MVGKSISKLQLPSSPEKIWLLTQQLPLLLPALQLTDFFAHTFLSVRASYTSFGKGVH